MKPIKANDFLGWLQGEVDAFCSILQIREDRAKELLDKDKELDAARSRLAHHMMQDLPAPINRADALQLALERAELKLQIIKQTAESFAPILEL